MTVPDLGTRKPAIRVDEDGCWIWQMAKRKLGYGVLTRTRNGVTTSRAAHCLVYEILVGPIPDGLELDHLCRVPWCVNPEHMEPVTHAENIRRGAMGHLSELRRPKPWPTHCPKGHAYDEKNTAVNDRNRPVCRRCSSDKTIRWQRRAAGIDVPKIAVAKLTEVDVRYIRASNLSGYQLAHRFGVAPLTVSKARRGITWKHLL